jgi:fructosamine-3-kinase
VSALGDAVGAALGEAVASEQRVGGGSINVAFAFVLDSGRRLFVKTRADAAPGEFAGEAAGLRWLAEPGAVAVPGVVAVGDDDAAPRYLALEWIEPGALGDRGAEELGRGLAALHAAGAAAFGADREWRVGELSLPNAPLETWPRFYAEQRLAPLVASAGLSAAGRAAVERVCARIDELAGPAEPPARLHGDLWGGNVMAGADGRARLIDPAAYGGHREVDLAMLRLFGSPGGERVFDAYAEAAPLAEGHQERVGLWQLFPMLVHAVLFGGSYVGRAERLARGYA